MKFYFDQIRNSGELFRIQKCRDERSSKSGSNWRAADRACTIFLNNEVREPEELLLTKHAVLKITENLNDLNIPQGTLCLLVRWPTDSDDVDVRLSPWRDFAYTINP